MKNICIQPSNRFGHFATNNTSLLLVAMLFFFSSAYAQKLFLPNGDTLNGPIKRMTTYDGYPTAWRIKYESYFDTVNREIRGEIYISEGGITGLVGRELLKYNDVGLVTEYSLLCADRTPCKSTKILYNEQGRMVENYYVHYMMTSQEWPGKCNSLLDAIMGGITEWFSGIDSVSTLSRYEYDDNGGVTRTVTENLTVATAYNETTIHECTFNYENNGNKTQDKKIKIKIKDGVADTSVEITNYRYDAGPFDTAITKESIIIWGENADTSVEVNHERYRPQDNKLVEKIRLSFRKESSWPDTTFEITEYRYDARGNKTEEWLYTDIHATSRQNWQINGKDVTTRTVFSYDNDNRLLDRREYFRYDEYYTEMYSKGHTGIYIGKGKRNAYDILGRLATYSEYKLYLQDDGTEKEHVTFQNAIPEENRMMPRDEIDRVEYDQYGNKVKSIENGRVSYARVIEYY